jgi:serine/threonine protein kinase
MAWRIGQHLGPYEVEGVKEGGMGLVLLVRRGEEPHAWKRVLKTFWPWAMDIEKVRDAFRQEATNWIFLSRHPNVVKAEGIFRWDDSLFVVAERVEPDVRGVVTVLDAIEQRGCSVQEVVQHGVQICRALDWAGRQLPGFVHRDIKPGNILLSGSSAKLNDFGLSGAALVISEASDGRLRRASALRRPGQMDVWAHRKVGTPEYMAPEVIRAGEASLLSDIYSFGATLYHMATGRPMFSGTLEDVFEGHLRGAPVSPRCIRQELPPALETVIMKCLCRAPTERWCSFREIGEALQRIHVELTGQPAPRCPDFPRLIEQVESLRSLGEEQLAAAVLNKALESPDDDARFEAAVMLTREGRHSEAADIFKALLRSDRVLSVTPETLALHAVVALYNSRRYGEVEEAAAEVRAADPAGKAGFVELYRGMAILVGRRDVSEAERYFKFAADAHPDNADIDYGIGLAWMHFGREDKAEVHFRRALQLRHAFPGALYNLALICRERGKTREALEFFKKFLNIERCGFFADEARRYVEQMGS